MTTSTARSRVKPGASKIQPSRQTTSTNTSAQRSTTHVKIPSQLAKKGVAQTAQTTFTHAPSNAADATEGFNTTLKLLSEALKERASDGLTHVQSEQNRSGTQDQTPTRSPLQTRSPNRPGKKPANSIPCQDGKLGKLRNTDDLKKVGEKAIACLSRLYQLKEGEGKHQKPLLDQGSLTLSTKLLGLGLVDLVIQELCNFGQRLHGPQTKSEPDHLRNGTVPASSRLKDLVSYLQKRPPAVDSQKEATHNLNYQTLILKVLARQGPIPNALLDVLDTASEQGPSQFITYCSSKGFLTAEEALQRQSNLFQLTLALGNSIRDLESSPRKRKTKYELSCLSLELRCVYWQAGGQDIDLTRELWKPFTRHLNSLNAVAVQNDVDDNTFVFTRFEKLRKWSSQLSRSADDSPPSFVLQALGDLASRIGEPMRALSFFREAEASSGDRGELSGTVLACKTAVTSLSRIGSPNDDEVINAVNAAVVSLQSPLKGGLRELDSLLSDVVQLRRATAQAILRLSKHPGPDYDPVRKNLQYACSDAITACVRFFLRYLRATENANTSVMDGKLGKFLGSVQSAIDSALAVLRNKAVYNTKEEWKDSEQALSDVHQLAIHILERVQDDDSSFWRTVFSRVSNIICCRVQVVPIEAKVDVLRKAIGIVQKRPPEEWRGGALCAKYEKLASLLYGQGAVADAISAYRMASRACLDPETLLDLSKLIAEGAPGVAWAGDGENIRRLDSVILSHVKLGIKGLRKVSECCDELVDRTVPEYVRVTLLERYLQHLQQAHPSKVPQSLAIALVRQVLSLYNPAEYPLRRIRVLLSILSQSSKQSQILFSPILDELAIDETHFQISEQDLGHDACLKSQKNVLVTCFQIVSAFHLGRPSTDLLESTVDSWDGLLQSLGHKESLTAHIEYPDQFLGHINTIVDYTDAMGLDKIQLRALQVMRKTLKLNASQDSIAISGVLIQLAILHTRNADIREAEKYLVEAKNILATCPNEDLIYLRKYLVWAELGLEMGDFDMCSDSLEQARKRAVAITTSNTSYSKMTLDRLLRNAALLKSRMCREVGQINQAELYARQSTKLSIRIWTILENSEVESGTDGPSNAEGNVDVLTKRFAALNTTPEMQSRLKDSAGPIFWPHFSDHIRSLLNLSFVTAYNGASQDAVYYAEQAEKLAKSIGSAKWFTRARAVLADHYLGGGLVDKAMELLDTCQDPQAQGDLSMTTFHVERTLAKANCLEGYWKTALVHTANAAKALESLSVPSSGTQSLLCESSETAAVPIRPVKPRLKNTQIKRTTTRKPPAKKDLRQPTPLPGVRKLANTSRFAKLCAELVLQNVEIHATGNQLEEALDLLTESIQTKTGFDGALRKASLLFQAAKTDLQNDTVHGVLVDSAISWPSRESSTSNLRQNQKGRKKNAVSSPADTLEQILGILSDGRASLQDSASVGCIRLFMELEAQTKLLLSAIRTNVDVSGRQLLQIGHLAKNNAIEREVSAIKIELHIQNLQYLSLWPGAADPKNGLDSIEDLSSSSALCQGDASTLPASWKVISVSISQDKKELLLGKMQRGREAFTLRLPIQRQPEEEDDDEIEPFDYDACRSEFLEIVEEANTSAHATGGSNSTNDKQAKKDWWARRENLDQKLGCLLENIENIWLGGYRGIFCPDTPDEERLGDFAQSLARVLDSHLPSRQKSSASSRIKVHKNVVDLFIGLGDPDVADLIDPVADLLAFVVDILQFSGEANAYDEIDFDMMTIETIDAIRAYHKRVTTDQSRSNHTILILDKDLLCLPWESLPCLRGKSVSRVPSLRCLQVRLDQMRSSSSIPASTSTTIDGISIPSTSGSYILNPSRDLTSTHSLFSPILSSSLPTFSSIDSRPPTEDEFHSNLTNSSLLLYFGHGSGAQYIRGRTIRKTQHQRKDPAARAPAAAAAVTFLMGCSSAMMHEAGARSPDFSPYGVPANYMHAGSPALVGTLWDVTDKDIDRFALHALVRWGLLEPETLRSLDREKSAKTKAKRKGKGVSKAVANGNSDGNVKIIKGGKDVRGAINLSQAVADAREDACVLRYLNAAAVVVWGVPVYLS